MQVGRRTGAFIVAASLTAILACLPWSGWLVRQQLRAAVGGSLSNAAAGKTPTSAEREQERQTASAYPDDFPLQLAVNFPNRPGILSAPENAPSRTPLNGESDATQAAQSLWNLRSRFSREPSLYANILRYMTMDAVRIRRETELQELEPESKRNTSSQGKISSRPQNTPAYLSLFDEASAIGERLDPQNGYFPAMRAIGLFAAHRDSEALAAIHRASTKSEWREYSSDEVRGNWRLMTLTYGEPGSLARLGQLSSLLFPHYAPLRNAARLATVQAIHLESDGDTRQGYYLRRDIARLGALIRTRSSYMIGTLVGSDIVRTAQSRPGGSIALEKPLRISDTVWDAKIEAIYGDYLRKIGEPREVRFIESESSAANQIEQIRKRAWNDGFGSWGNLLFPVAGIRIAGTALLSSAIVLVLFGALCLVLPRAKSLKHKTAKLCVVFLSIVLLTGTMIVLGTTIIEPWNNWTSLFSGMAYYDDSVPDPSIWEWRTIAVVLPHLVGIVTLAVPMVFVCIQAKCSQGPNQQGAIGFVRHCAAAALPTVTVLLLAYTAVTLETLWIETSVRTEADQINRSENAYLARIANQPLPGFSEGQTVILAQDTERVR
jgi:hypothetical protein